MGLTARLVYALIGLRLGRGRTGTVIASTLDTFGALAAPALPLAGAPTGVLVAAAAGGVLLLVVIVVVVLLAARNRKSGDAQPASSEDAVERRAGWSRVLLLRLEGDLDGAVGQRISTVLSSGLDQGAVVDGGAGVKTGRGLDEEIRRARAHAAKTRANVVLWGSVADGAARLRIIGQGGEGPCEAYSLPAELPAPFDAALLALVAASGDQPAALAKAAEKVAPGAPNDPDHAARLRAVKARAALVAHLRDRDRGQLDAALAATAVSDPREEAEPLEWAEVQSLRGEALRRAVAGLAEPPRKDVGARVDAWRAAMGVWREQGVVDRIERAQAPLAEALLDRADVENDPRGLEEAAELTAAALSRKDPRANGVETTALTAMLGAVQLRLGERDARPARLEAAERELRRALVLAEASNDRVRAVSIRDELARALAKLGERDRGTDRLRAAAVIYRLSLADHHGNELGRARARAALGRALVSVGERDRDVSAVDEAVAALRTASNSLASCGAQAAAAQARRALERAERLYGELRAASRATVEAD